MGCPSVGEAVQSAVRKCPFLGQIAADHGEAYACSIAVNPARPTYEPVLPESLLDFRHSFRLFHGAGGVVPLVRSKDTEKRTPESIAVCPHSNRRNTTEMSASQADSEPGEELREAVRSCESRDHSPGSAFAAAPFASLSTRVFSFLPGPGGFIAKQRKKRQERKDKRSDARQSRGRAGKTGASNSSQSKIERWRQHPIVGGLIPLTASGKYACPPLIIAGRQAVAKLRSTQVLRPQALHVKLMGVGTQCLVANIPFGAVREHTAKFSLAWFLAVHATVPYFAFMRKGVGMPKWGIALTLAAAITGQAIGARLERSRLAYAVESKQRRERETAGGALCAVPNELGQRCPVLKTCAEIAQSHYISSDTSVSHPVMA